MYQKVSNEKNRRRFTKEEAQARRRALVTIGTTNGNAYGSAKLLTDAIMEIVDAEGAAAGEEEQLGEVMQVHPVDGPEIKQEPEAARVGIERVSGSDNEAAGVEGVAQPAVDYEDQVVVVFRAV